jgi:hypothetical protein
MDQDTHGRTATFDEENHGTGAVDGDDSTHDYREGRRQCLDAREEV